MLRLSTRASRRAALAIGLLPLLIELAGIAWFLAARRSLPGLQPYSYWREGTVTAPIFIVLGTLIAVRRPGHRIGWLFLALGYLTQLQMAAGQYATASLALPPGALPAPGVAAGVAQVLQTLAVQAAVVLLFIFPTGALPPGRWRPIFWLTLAGFALALPELIVRPGAFDDFPTINNPFAAPAVELPLQISAAIGLTLVVLGLLAAVVLLIVRLRCAQGAERQQFKWFAYTAAMSVLALLALQLLFPELNNGIAGNLIWTLSFASLPVSVAIGVLRYRLYDIDIIIRRTLVYAVLTGTLAVVYFASVVGLEAVLRLATGQAAASPLVVVVSTLLIAALFVPLRRRIQAWIDQRFYRSQYDAARTLQEFAATIRDETDLAALTQRLSAVVDGSVRPVHISLWLREPSSGQVGQPPASTA